MAAHACEIEAREEKAEGRPSACEDSLARYLREIGRYPLLGRAEELELARRAGAGDEQARRRLVESNLRLVVSIARGYRGLGLELLDLVQEGNLGLIEAVQRYDWRRDVKLATYAAWWIRRAICAALSTKSRLVRLPARLAEATTAVGRAERRLAQELGREPSVAEVAAATGISEDAVAAVRRAGLRPLSLSETYGDDGDLTLEELVADEAGTDPAAGDRSDERTGVVVAFSCLRGRSRRLLELRYGLDGDDPRTLEEIASELGLSRERVRSLETQALRALAARPELRALQPAA